MCCSAGYANQEAGRLDMAFVFFNRYLDLTEAMEDPDAGPLENADFVNTDIPFYFHIPETHYISETMREEVTPLHHATAFTLALTRLPALLFY